MIFGGTGWVLPLMLKTQHLSSNQAYNKHVVSSMKDDPAFPVGNINSFILQQFLNIFHSNGSDFVFIKLMPSIRYHVIVVVLSLNLNHHNLI